MNEPNKSNKFLSFLKGVVVALVGWILMSMFAILPQSLSCPLPKIIQQYNSYLYFTGYSANALEELKQEEARIEAQLKEEEFAKENEQFQLILNDYMIEAGYFENLDLFATGNLYQRHFYNKTDNSINPTDKLDACKFNLNDGEIVDYYDQAIPNNDLSVLLTLGNDYIIKLTKGETEIEFVSINENQPSGIAKPTIDFSYQNFGEVCDYASKILEKQVNSEITLQELVDLLYLTNSYTLRFWAKDEHITAFKLADVLETDSQMSTYYVYNTESLELISRNSYANAEISCFNSECEITYYDPSTSEINMINVTTGEKYGVLTGVTSLNCLNVAHNSKGELVVGGLLTENKYFFYNYVTKAQDVGTIENAELDNFIFCGNDKFALFDYKGVAGYSYSIKDFKEAE